MGVVHYELVRLRQKEIEVQALVALANINIEQVSFKAVQRLEQIAYPEEVNL
tara:strand:+ start:159 stop:314 length:156 start_codon:yes stop_codon:yes gene_type:complete